MFESNDDKTSTLSDLLVHRFQQCPLAPPSDNIDIIQLGSFPVLTDYKIEATYFDLVHSLLKQRHRLQEQNDKNNESMIKGKMMTAATKKNPHTQAKRTLRN